MWRDRGARHMPVHIRCRPKTIHMLTREVSMWVRFSFSALDIDVGSANVSAWPDFTVTSDGPRILSDGDAAPDLIVASVCTRMNPILTSQKPSRCGPGRCDHSFPAVDVSRLCSTNLYNKSHISMPSAMRLPVNTNFFLWTPGGAALSMMVYCSGGSSCYTWSLYLTLTRRYSCVPGYSAESNFSMSSTVLLSSNSGGRVFILRWNEEWRALKGCEGSSNELLVEEFIWAPFHRSSTLLDSTTMQYQGFWTSVLALFNLYSLKK